MKLDAPLFSMETEKIIFSADFQGGLFSEVNNKEVSVKCRCLKRQQRYYVYFVLRCGNNTKGSRRYEWVKMIYHKILVLRKLRL